MCWHIADPQVFWDPDKVSEKTKAKGWFYGDGTYPSYEKLIDLAYTFLDHHPKLNLLLAHMFFKSFEPDEIVNLLEKYPNVCLDFSLGWGMFNGFRTHYEKWCRIFRSYSDRFVFATDAATNAAAESLQNRVGYVRRFLETDDEYFVRENCTAHGVKLEHEHLEKILYKNHERTVGKAPAPINQVALKKHIERYLPLMPNTKNRALTEAYYRKKLL